MNKEPLFKIDFDDLCSSYAYQKFDELPKDILIELLIRNIKRIAKAIQQMEETKNNAIEYKSYHDAVIFSELINILKGDSND